MTTKEESDFQAPDAWRKLLAGATDLAWTRGGEHGIPAGNLTGSSDRTEARTIFPGAFNPLHAGHRRMAKIAAERLGRPVEFEISVTNVDKAPLDFRDLDRRARQFSSEETVWLTTAATFVEKTRLFPEATFAVGADTIRRVADVRYYNNSLAARDDALREIAATARGFLVFGRLEETDFHTVDRLDLPEQLLRICNQIPEECFRMDVSSTVLRKKN